MFATALFIFSTLYIFLHPDIAQEAVFRTSMLCVNSIIPSLFPCFIITNLWIRTGYAYKLSQQIGKITHTLFRLTPSLSHILLIGCISGFPLGAHSLLQLYNDQKISKDEAEQALMICSNAGPAFVIGFVGAYLFGSILIGFILWLIQVAAAMMIGIIFRPQQTLPVSTIHPDDISENFLSSLTNAILQAGDTIIRICIMVTFFALLKSYITVHIPLPLQSSELFIMLIGSLELFSGIVSLQNVPPATAFVWASALISWNGLCVHCQVMSSIRRTLSLNKYFLGKAMHILISTVISIMMSGLFFSDEAHSSRLSPIASFSVFLIIGLLIMRLFEKTSSGKKSRIRI